jgi:hypothetical protein
VKFCASIALSLLLAAAGCATRKVEPTRNPLVDRSGLCLPASGHPDEQALHASATRARALLDDTIATSGNERPETRRQFADPKEFPIQRFPRLTTPLITDPETLESGARHHTPAWFVPLILDREQLGDVDQEHLTGEFAFWLVLHGEDVGRAAWREITDCLIRDPANPAEIVTLDETRIVSWRAPDELVPTIAGPQEFRGLVFEIPTRTVRAGDRLDPGFYDLKVLPVLNALREVRVETRAISAFKTALQRGDWPAALKAVGQIEPEDLSDPAAIDDLRRIGEAIEPSPSPWSVIEHPSPNFEDDLRSVAEGVARLADKLEKGSDSAVELRLLQLSGALRTVLSSPRSLAPVALEDPAGDRERCGGRSCIRIAVGGDFQYHGDASALLRFFGALDPSILPGAGDDPEASGDTAPPGPTRDVDFVLFAGDLADAAAGSAKADLLLNALGVLPVTSPYGHGGAGEMLTLRDHLSKFRVPFFAVPGNHDGYAGFGGILNVPFDELGELVQKVCSTASPRLGRTFGNGIKSMNDFIPSLVGWRLLTRHPRWDGLGEYQNILGSLNLAFKFRGHSFIGLNSYDLKPKERASVGGVVLYYGGGLQNGTVEWVEDMLNRFAPDPGHEQILFTHHDPRSATPANNNYRQQNYGRYDAIDTPISQLTFGHLGLGNSPRTGLYLPLVSYLGTEIAHLFDVGWGADIGGSHQVWMRKPDWGLSKLPKTRRPRFYDWSSYNARGLIEVINCNLAARRRSWEPASADREGRCADPQGQISQILFAHDNVPLDDLWADPNERGAVFRQPVGGQVWREPGWENSWNSQLVSGLLGGKTRSGSPPGWAQDMRIAPDEGNAAVLRMDDVGDIGSVSNYHGFHVLTLYEDGEREMEWVPLPR